MNCKKIYLGLLIIGGSFFSLVSMDDEVGGRVATPQNGNGNGRVAAQPTPASATIPERDGPSAEERAAWIALQDGYSQPREDGDE